jgi:hypothetical protein
MQTTLRLSILTLLIACLFSSAGNAQDLGDQLSKISGGNVEGYLGPLVSGLGASLNSGLYYSADLHSVLGFDVGIKYMYVPMKSADKTFDFATPASITVAGNTYHAGTDYAAKIAEPTVVGSKSTNPFTVGGISAPIPLPGGFDQSFIPMLVPQASIGLPFNLEVMARFMPSTKLGDAGKLGLYGFGIRHDLDHYIAFFPIDVAIHFALQNFEFSDMSGNKLLSTKTTAFGLEASKSLVFLTLYTGVQIENSNFSIAPYDIKDQSGTVIGHFDGTNIKGADKTRFLVGFRMLLAIINLHADYSFSKYPVLTAGVGISFR